MVIAYRGRKGRMVEAGSINLGLGIRVSFDYQGDLRLTCQIPRMILGANAVSQFGYCSTTDFMSVNNLVGSFSTLQSIYNQLGPFCGKEPHIQLDMLMTRGDK